MYLYLELLKVRKKSHSAIPEISEMRKDLPPQNQNKSPQAKPEKGPYRLPHVSKKVPKDEIAKDNSKNSLRFGKKRRIYR
jgi:hypothetical protein